VLKFVNHVGHLPRVAVPLWHLMGFLHGAHGILVVGSSGAEMVMGLRSLVVELFLGWTMVILILYVSLNLMKEPMLGVNLILRPGYPALVVFVDGVNGVVVVGNAVEMRNLLGCLSDCLLAIPVS
jgi:hypothetical protein